MQFHGWTRANWDFEASYDRLKEGRKEGGDGGVRNPMGLATPLSHEENFRYLQWRVSGFPYFSLFSGKIETPLHKSYPYSWHRWGWKCIFFKYLKCSGENVELPKVPCLIDSLKNEEFAPQNGANKRNNQSLTFNWFVGERKLIFQSLIFGANC